MFSSCQRTPFFRPLFAHSQITQLSHYFFCFYTFPQLQDSAGWSQPLRQNARGRDAIRAALTISCTYISGCFWNAYINLKDVLRRKKNDGKSHKELDWRGSICKCMGGRSRCCYTRLHCALKYLCHLTIVGCSVLVKKQQHILLSH